MNYQDICEKEKFYTIHLVDNKEKLSDFFDLLSSKPDCIWRGLPNALFSNYNSLQIKNLNNDELNSIEKVLSYIDKLDKEFDKWNNGLLIKYFNNYNIIEVPILAKLSILRHYGVPTPFLDWTRNPYVALYFATELKAEKPDYISLYCITPSHPYYTFDFKAGIEEGIKSLPSYKTKLKERLDFMARHGDKEILKQSEKNFHKEFCQNIFSNINFVFENLRRFPINRIEDNRNENLKLFINNNYNITAQEGLFIINCYPNLPLEKAIFARIKERAYNKDEQLKGEKICKENFLCFDISTNLIEEILNFLNKKNIKQRIIYPDLRNLKNDIK